MRLVLFDVDGTLVDSQASIHECMRRTFAEFGHAEPELAAVRAIIGLSLDQAVARLLDGAEGDIAAMSVFYKRNWLTVQALPEFEARLFDGIADLLGQLAASDEVVLGLVTGKSRRGVARLLDHHNLNPVFSTIRTADDCPSKPHPAMVEECCAEAGIEPAQTFVVGDTVFDMEMARAAGARAIGVAWGYHPVEALSQAGAAAIAGTAGDLAELLVPVRAI